MKICITTTNVTVETIINDDISINITDTRDAGVTPAPESLEADALSIETEEAIGVILEEELDELDDIVREEAPEEEDIDIEETNTEVETTVETVEPTQQIKRAFATISDLSRPVRTAPTAPESPASVPAASATHRPTVVAPATRSESVLNTTAADVPPKHPVSQQTSALPTRSHAPVSPVSPVSAPPSLPKRDGQHWGSTTN